MNAAVSAGGAIRVFVVEDDEKMLDILTRHLDRMGYAVRGARGAGELLERLREEPAEIILSDIRMPGMDGLTLLQVVKEKYPGTHVVLMTAFGSVDSAVQAMQAGAYSYVCKPFKVEEIAAVLRNAAREITLGRQVTHLRKAVRGQYSVEQIIGNSAVMQRVRQHVLEAASVMAPVLITGRSGTGKELAARAIHYAGPRAAGPFVPVNCSAVPETLFESEMFGHRKGAFTGADRDRPGLIEQASGGTLFLDEVGEIPLPQQPKLLRVLEEREVRPLGASAPVAVDLRVICATNRSLEAMVRQGEFREDLFFRINVLPIAMPELAARPEDVAPLADHLLIELAQENGIPCRGFTPDALEILAHQRWPGNVRELRNVIERALLKVRGARINVEDLSPESRDRLSKAAAPGAPPRSEWSRTLAEIEKEHILRVLDACGWNRSAAAHVLGIDRRTLFSKIQRYGLIGPGRPFAATDGGSGSVQSDPTER